MQAYEGYYENGRFYIEGEEPGIVGRKKAIITFLEDVKPKKKPVSESFGIFKGKIHMSDDFDAPLEEMKEYM